MPREKIIKDITRKFHNYNEEEHNSLYRLRDKAKSILLKLEEKGIKAFVHGSVARGDVTGTSDIDIFIPYNISSFRLDLIDIFANAERRIIMGTTNSNIKGLLTIPENISVSFPLTPPTEREVEFYKFSGSVYLKNIQANEYVPGVTKQLLLIEPANNGYWISSILNNKKRAMKCLKISQQMIDERIRVLTRRNKIGRTGKFLDHLLSPDENFEHTLHQLSSHNIIVRRKLQRSNIL
ncbi:MAG: nucleotidyltransferase domain-containing protein [Candidatus Heimdallarchaeota archaeon]|nr:nucleotidyltransferase domain-containing protein [Candidatus Heimdallarchaeota archaeon]